MAKSLETVEEEHYFIDEDGAVDPEADIADELFEELDQIGTHIPDDEASTMCHEFFVSNLASGAYDNL